MTIAAYCRVSTEKEEQLDSLHHQKEFFTTYADRNQHQLYKLYADEGISGTSLKKRDAFRQLMQDAKRGMFQMVVVKDISRFARNTVDALQSIRTLKSMGINTLFLTANMDSMGDSEFILTLFSAMAQEESNNLSKRVKWGKRINAEKGRVPPKLFGYDRLDNFTLVINPAEARTVRKIFMLYVDQGLGCRSISLALNQDAEKTKLGCQWNPRAVRRILTNPIYCGTLVNHKYEIGDFLTGKQISIPASEHFYHPRPQWAIISPEQFQRAQKILAQRQVKYDSGPPFRQGRYSGKHTFSTLIKCPHCGRSFCRKRYTYTNTRVYWRCVTNDQYTAESCDNRISLDEKPLLDALARYITSTLGDPETFVTSVAHSLADCAPSEENTDRQIKQLQLQAKRLEKKKHRYQELFANEMLSLTELKSKLASLDKELAQISSDLEMLTEDSQTSQGKSFLETCKCFVREFLKMENLTNSDMRKLLEYISVDRYGEVTIRFQGFPSPDPC